MAPKPKAKPSPASSQPPPAIEDLFTKLNSHIEGSSDPSIEQSELEKAVRFADQGSNTVFLIIFTLSASSLCV